MLENLINFTSQQTRTAATLNSGSRTDWLATLENQMTIQNKKRMAK